MYKIKIVKERKVLALCQKKIIKTTTKIITAKRITKIIKTEIITMKTIITVDN